MSLGLEIAGPSLKYNLDMRLGMVRAKDGYAEKIIIFEEILGFKYEQIVYATTSDRAAKGSVTMFNYDEDACDIRDCDKIGKLVIGDITKSRNKV